MRISDWSSDVCSSDLVQLGGLRYTAAADSTITVGVGNTLGVDGTLIVAPSVLANDQTITGGFLTGGAGGGTLGVQQHGAGTFTIASTIVDNGAATSLAKGGPGPVAPPGANSHPGSTTPTNHTLRLTPPPDRRPPTKTGTRE